MSIPSYNGANVEIAQHTFSHLIGRTNQLIYDMGTTVMTVAAVAQPNTTNGAYTTGNTFLVGMFGANTVIATNALRGGTHSLPAPLTISTNTIFQGSANIAGPDITLGSANTALIRLNGEIGTNIVPRANTTIDIGAATRHVRRTYSLNVFTRNIEDVATISGAANTGIVYTAVTTNINQGHSFSITHNGTGRLPLFVGPDAVVPGEAGTISSGNTTLRWSGVFSINGSYTGNMTIDGNTTIGTNLISQSNDPILFNSSTGNVNFAANASRVIMSGSGASPFTLTIGSASSANTNLFSLSNELYIATNSNVANTIINIGKDNWLGTLNLGRPNSLTRFLGTTESTSATVGAVTFAGGVGIAKRLNVTGATALTGALTGSTYVFSGTGRVNGAFTANSTSTFVGAATFQNTVSVSGALNVANTATVSSLIVNGASTMNGTLTASSNVIITGNTSLTGSLSGSSYDFTGAGRVRGAFIADANATIGGNLSVAGNTALTGMLSLNNFDVAQSGRIRGNLTVDGDLILSNSDIQVSLDVANQNHATINNTFTLLGTANSHIIPSPTVTFDLGSSTNYWRDVFSNQYTIKSGGTGYTIIRSTTNFTGSRFIDLPNGNVTLRTGNTAVLADKFTDMAAVTATELFNKVNGTRGTGDLVFHNSPVLIRPEIADGFALRNGTNVNRVATILNPATSNTEITLPTVSGALALVSNIGTGSVTLNTGSGLSGSGSFGLNDNGTTTITFQNTDRGSTQNIFKNVSNAAGAVQFSANNNNDAITFAAGAGLSVSFTAANKTVRYDTLLAGGDGVTVTANSVVAVDGTVTRNTRVLTAGDGLTGGGDLSADRTFSVDSTVVRTTRSIATGWGLAGGGNLAANRTLSVNQTALDERYAVLTRTLTAGDGLTGGGALSSNPSFAVDGTVVRTHTNQVIGGTKTFSAAQIIMSAPGQTQTAPSLQFAEGTGVGYSVDGASRLSLITDGIRRLIVDTTNNRLVLHNTFSYYGNGSGLTNLDGSAVATGTVADARLPNTVVRTSLNLTATDGIQGGGNLTGNRTFSVDSTVVRSWLNLTVGWAMEGGGNLSADRSFGVDKSVLDTFYAQRSITLSGGDGITTTIGNLTDNRSISVDASVARRNANNNFTGNIQLDGGALTVRAPNSGTAPSVYFRSSDDNLLLGYVRFASAGWMQFRNYSGGEAAGGFDIGATGNFNLVGGGQFNGNGAGLTALNANQLTTGTVPDARLSDNVVMTSGAQTINGLKTFGGTVNALTFNATSAIGGAFLGVVSDSTTNCSFTWSGDVHTGFYRIADGVIGVSSNGTEVLRFTAAGISGSANVLTDLDANQLSRGQVPAARLNNVGQAISNMSAGAVGAYAYLYHVNGGVNLNVNQNYAGSALRYGGTQVTNQTSTIDTDVAPAGTWKCMSQANPTDGRRAGTIFMRVA